MYDLKKRITRNLMVNIALVMSALLIVFYFFTQQILQDYILTRLQHDAESLASRIQQDADQRWQLAASDMRSVYDRVRSGHYYIVIVDQQVIESRSLFDAEFPPSPEHGLSAANYILSGPGDEVWLVWQQSVTKNGHLINIRVAENILPVQDQLIRYLAYTLLIILVAVSLMVYLQQRTLHRAFLIFEWLRQNLASIRHKETDKSAMQIPREVLPLVEEIEKLVEHLGNRIDRTRQAIGNLAHELKRPLQLLSIQQASDANQSQSEILEQIKDILERELRRARISGSSSSGGHFKIGEELKYLLDVLGKIYPHIEIWLEFENRDETLNLDRNDMLELIGNLLDNACKFASQRVKLTVELTDQLLILVVEDDGKGLHTEQLEQLGRRGMRLDETVAGHGLGLTICNDIVDYHHGEIAFTRSSYGGLQVNLRIPLQ